MNIMKGGLEIIRKIEMDKISEGNKMVEKKQDVIKNQELLGMFTKSIKIKKNLLKEITINIINKEYIISSNNEDIMNLIKIIDGVELPIKNEHLELRKIKLEDLETEKIDEYIYVEDLNTGETSEYLEAIDENMEIMRRYMKIVGILINNAHIIKIN